MQLQLIGGQGLQITGLDTGGVQPLQIDSSLINQLQPAGAGAITTDNLGDAGGHALPTADPNLVQNVQVCVFGCGFVTCHIYNAH